MPEEKQSAIQAPADPIPESVEEKTPISPAAQTVPKSPRRNPGGKWGGSLWS